MPLCVVIRFLRGSLSRSGMVVLLLLLGVVLASYRGVGRSMETGFDPVRILGERLVVGVVEPPRSALRPLLETDPRVRVIAYSGNRGAAQDDMMHRGILDAIVVVETASLPARVSLYLPPENDPLVPILVHLLRQNLRRYEDQLRAQRAGDRAPQLVLVHARRPGPDNPPGAARLRGLFFGLVLPWVLLAPGFILSALLLEFWVEEDRTGTLQLLLSAVRGDVLARWLCGGVWVLGAGLTAGLLAWIHWIGLLRGDFLPVWACANGLTAALPAAVLRAAAAKRADAARAGLLVFAAVSSMVWLRLAPAALLAQLCLGTAGPETAWAVAAAGLLAAAWLMRVQTPDPLRT